MRERHSMFEWEGLGKSLQVHMHDDLTNKVQQVLSNMIRLNGLT